MLLGYTISASYTTVWNAAKHPPSSGKPENSNLLPGKVMASVLWTAEGVIHVELMPRGTVLSDCVGPVAVLCVCRPAARQRDDRRELLTCVHWELVDRASFLYCCHLFGPPQQHVGGRWFHGDEEMEMAVREWLRLQEPDFYMYRVFKTFAEMGAKYIDVLVDYTDMLTLY